MAEKNLAITAQGLVKVSKELINKRTFDSSKITIVGNPIISGDKGSSFSASNYFQYSELDFSEAESIKINIVGTISVPSATPQCMYSITSNTNSSLPLFLNVFSSKIELCLNDVVLAGTTVSYSNNSVVNLSLKLTSTTYEITVLNNNTFEFYTGNLTQEIDITQYTTLTLGRSTGSINNYWNGNIDLSEVLVFKDDVLVYAPSNDSEFKFTKIMISDGLFPLTDNSELIIDHVYAFDVTEIKRTGNNILLTATIGDDVYLDIEQIGLYSTGNDGNILFALLDGLSIKKTSDLDYNLIFTVNLDLNVVNTIAMPEIVMHKGDQGVFKDFITIKQVFDYLETNLERIIDMNASELGYGRLQEIWKIQNNLELWEDNFNNTQRYSKIANKIKPTSTYSYDSSKVTTTGSQVIPASGDLSNITTANYAYLSKVFTEAPSTLSMDVKFQASINQGTNQTILNYYAPTYNQPLVLGIDSNNSCFLKVGAMEKITATINGNQKVLNRLSSGDRIDSGTQYYAWITTDGNRIINPHVGLQGSIQVINGSLTGFSTSNYATIADDLTLSNSFEIEIRIMTSDIPLTGVQTLISGINDYYFKIELQSNNKLTYYIGNGTAWVHTVNGTTALGINSSYNIKLEFDGTEYKGYIIDEAGLTTEDCTIVSTAVIPTFKAKLGLNNASANPWGGYIDLTETNIKAGSYSWEGVRSSLVVYTTTNTPTTSSVLYDEDVYTVLLTTVNSVSKSNLINTSLFSVTPLTTYYLRIVFDGEKYDVLRSLDSKNYTRIYRLQSSELMNQPNFIYFGVSKSASSASTPFLGTLNLGEFKVTYNNENVSPLIYAYNNKTLKDFYSFSEFPYSHYKVNNLSGLENSQIEYFEGSITGQDDKINFSDPEGFTICVKLFLESPSSRVILSKINEENEETYFSLEYNHNDTTYNDTLSFKLYTEDSTILLQKSYSMQTFRSITDNPVSLFIVCDKSGELPLYKLYKNNELLDTLSNSSTTYLNELEYYLANYGVGEDATNNVIQNILTFSGALTASDIYYINNILDTNF